MTESDVLIGEFDAKPAKADSADNVPAVETKAVTRLDDIVQIGPLG